MDPELLADIKSWLDSITDPARDLPDEATCRRVLADIRFQPGFACPHCGSQNGARRGVQHPHWRCSETTCRYRTSVTAGTIMHGTHLEARIWVAALWYQTHSPSGISAMEFSRVFDLAYFTAWRLNHTVRTCFAGSQRAGLVADATPSTTSIQILGRHRAEAEFQGHCALDVDDRDLVYATGPDDDRARAALPALDDGEPTKKKPNAPAHWLLESFRTAIIGTYRGVSVKWLPNYAREFFGRWTGTLVDVWALERLLAPRSIPRARLWDDQPPFEPDPDDPASYFEAPTRG